MIRCLVFNFRIIPWGDLDFGGFREKAYGFDNFSNAAINEGGMCMVWLKAVAEEIITSVSTGFAVPVNWMAKWLEMRRGPNHIMAHRSKGLGFQNSRRLTAATSVPRGTVTTFQFASSPPR